MDGQGFYYTPVLYLNSSNITSQVFRQQQTTTGSSNLGIISLRCTFVQTRGYTMTASLFLSNVVFEDLFLEKDQKKCRDCVQNIMSSNPEDQDRFCN